DVSHRLVTVVPLERRAAQDVRVHSLWRRVWTPGAENGAVRGYACEAGMKFAKAEAILLELDGFEIAEIEKRARAAEGPGAIACAGDEHRSLGSRAHQHHARTTNVGQRRGQFFFFREEVPALNDVRRWKSHDQLGQACGNLDVPRRGREI